MLKRHQVLIQDWLTDFIRYISSEYDVSFSEVIRVGMCVYFGTLISLNDSKIKYGVKVKDILNLSVSSKRKDAGGIQRKVLSKIYFETRKAIEARMNLEKKK